MISGRFACVFTPIGCVSTYPCYVLQNYSDMPVSKPKYLSCPEIARRIGYSRMQVTRWAKVHMIPGIRHITPGKQYRYELTPELAAWIRLRRRQGRERPWMGFMGALDSDKPAKRVISGKIICREIDELLEEIERRVAEITIPNPVPTEAELRALHERLTRSIDWLAVGKDFISGFLNRPR